MPRTPRKKSIVKTWFNRVIRETLERDTVSEETVTVHQRVKSADSESETVDSFGLYPTLPSEESDTESDIEETGTTSGSPPPSQFEIVMQKMDQMELQIQARDDKTDQLRKELQIVKTKTKISHVHRGGGGHGDGL